MADTSGSRESSEAKRPTARERDAGSDFYHSSQWRLMWFRFRKHRVAVISGIVILGVYLAGLFCQFLSPYDPNEFDEKHLYAPPQLIRFVHEGRISARPFVYAYVQKQNPTTLRRIYAPDTTRPIPVVFFPRGFSYKLFGIFPTRLHLYGAGAEGGTVHLLGTDRLGRDVFSRVLFGTRVSTTVGLVGVLLSLFLGVVIGGIAGYLGGTVDAIVQRVIEVIRSIPTLPLWMGLSAALPSHLPQTMVYFGITIILSLIGWTGLARVVRSKFLSLRDYDYVVAARLIGARKGRVIFRHILPNFVSHIIASITLSIPTMIIGETSLSFLGLGIRPPAISWGVLLQEAQNVRTVSLFPWLLLPGVAVVVVVLAFNFLGDGLRDAADPYSR